MYLLFKLGRINCKENFQDDDIEVNMYHKGNHCIHTATILLMKI